MRKLRLTFALLCAAGTAMLPAQAQNTTNLPTSMYGIGELSPGDGGRLSGMGNVGIALNRVGFQNTLNPAAITRMDSTCFTFDVGAAAAYARYAYLSDRSSSMTANPNRFSLGFRLRRRWYLMLGAAPYSSVGYVIRTEEVIEGMPGQYAYSSFQGEGGLYRCYLANAVRLTPRLSVGLNVGMVLGTVTQSETQEGATVEHESKKRAFYADWGLHYESAPTGGGRQWAAGLVFAPALPLSHDNELAYGNTSTSEELEKPYHSPQEYLPLHLGVGVAMSTARWTLAADYNYLDWSRNTSDRAAADYENQHKLNVGANYTLQPRRPRSAELMWGAGYSNSYISMKKGKLRYLETSAGISIPIRQSFLSLALAWRRQMNRRSNLMQESRWSLNFNLTFGERLSRSRIK